MGNGDLFNPLTINLVGNANRNLLDAAEDVQLG